MAEHWTGVSKEFLWQVAELLAAAEVDMSEYTDRLSDREVCAVGAARNDLAKWVRDELVGRVPPVMGRARFGWLRRQLGVRTSGSARRIADFLDGLAGLEPVRARASMRLALRDVVGGRAFSEAERVAAHRLDRSWPEPGSNVCPECGERLRRCNVESEEGWEDWMCDGCGHVCTVYGKGEIDDDE